MPIQLDIHTYAHPRCDDPFFQNLELAVPYSGICVLLGASGSGKTTLLQITGAFERGHFDGTREFWLDGEQVDLAHLRATAKIGYIPQQPALPSWRTARKCFDFIADLTGTSRPGLPEISSALRDARLPLDTLSLYPHELSGGMRRRLAIAATLAYSPRILFVDEPFAGLDSATAYAVMEILRSFVAGHEQERMALIVTHNAELASIMANTIYFVTRQQKLRHVKGNSNAKALVQLLRDDQLNLQAGDSSE